MSVSRSPELLHRPEREQLHEIFSCKITVQGKMCRYSPMKGLLIKLTKLTNARVQPSRINDVNKCQDE